MTREFIGDTRPQYSDAVEHLIEGVLGYLVAKGVSLEEDVKNHIAVNIARDSTAIIAEHDGGDESDAKYVVENGGYMTANVNERNHHWFKPYSLEEANRRREKIMDRQRREADLSEFEPEPAPVVYRLVSVETPR